MSGRLWERHIVVEFGNEIAPESLVLSLPSLADLGRQEQSDQLPVLSSVKGMLSRLDVPEPEVRMPKETVSGEELPPLSLAKLSKKKTQAQPQPPLSTSTAGEVAVQNFGPLWGVAPGKATFGLVDSIEHYWPDGKRWYIEAELEENNDPLTSDSGEVVIFNMSDARLDEIKERAEYLKFYAGYGRAKPPLLFFGHIDDIWSEWQGADRATHFSVSCVGNVQRLVQAYGAWPPPAKASTILRCLAGELPVPLGKFQLGKDFVYRAQKKFDPQSTVMEAIREVCRDCDSVAFIQRGILYIVPRSEPIDEVGWPLRPDNGLVGQPEQARRDISHKATLDGATVLDKPWKNWSKWTVVGLLDAAYRPQVRLMVVSRNLVGWVLIENVRHVIRRQDYYSVMTVNKLGEPTQMRSIAGGEEVAPIVAR